MDAAFPTLIRKDSAKYSIVFHRNLCPPIHSPCIRMSGPHPRRSLLP